MRLFVIATAGLVTAAGCAGGLTGPEAESFVASGLEQVVEVQTSDAQNGTYFAIRSTLRNTGVEPVSLTARTCYLRQEDLRGETSAVRVYEPLILCAAIISEITLAPGAASETLTMTGLITGGGDHEVEVRHALAPEAWARVTIPGS